MQFVENVKNIVRKWAGQYPWRYALFGGYGRIQETQYRYDMIANEAYGGNPVAYRCINMIASAVASVPYKLFERLPDGTEVEVEESPILDLLKKPNPVMGEQDFFHNLISYLQISGNTFVRRVGPNGGAPRELYLLCPEYITILPATCAEDYIQGYKYFCGRETETIDPEYVCHIKLYNPVCPYYGMSPALPAWRSIQQSNSAMNWNLSLLKNSAKPSGLLTPQHPISDDEFEELHQDIQQNQAGEFNAGTSMITNNMKWERMSLTPVEMDWMRGMVHAEKLIAISWGVDPVLIGDAQNRTYATFKDAQKSFYFDTVIPLLYKIQDFFMNEWLIPLFPNSENLFFRYDLDEIDAITEDRNLVYDRVREAYKDKLLTQNEAREVLGYGEMEAQLDAEGIEENDEQKEIVEEEKKNEYLTLASLDYIDSIEAMRKKWDLVVRVQVAKLFDEEKTNVMEAVSNSSPENVLKSALEQVDIEKWRRLYTTFYTNVMREFGEKTVRDYKQDNIFGNEESEVAAFVVSTINGRTKEVTDTTKKRLTEIILAAISAGILDIEGAIEKLYNHDTPIRSSAISQTEVITAGNAATRFAAKALNPSALKEWVSMRDNAVRLSHKMTDGEIRNMNEKYSNGLMFPGDPNGSAAEVINCRCIEIYHF